METIVFEKDEKRKEISLETLKQTASLVDPYVGKMPAHRPLEHWQLIETIAEKVDKKGYKFKPDPIFIGNGKEELKRIIQLDPENMGLVNAIVINRILTRLNFSGEDFGRKEYNTSIAIGYHERGIQMAFGTNIKVCANMCIFANRILYTYGSEKMPFEKMMQLVDEYIDNLPTIAKDDFRILETFKEFPVNDWNVIETVGEMQLMAVQSAYLKGESPFNIGQVSSFSQGVLKNSPKLLDLGGEDRIMSLYDFYNMGTEILHPKRAEMTTVWPSVAHWGDYLTKRFNVN